MNKKIIFAIVAAIVLVIFCILFVHNQEPDRIVADFTDPDGNIITYYLVKMPHRESGLLDRKALGYIMMMESIVSVRECNVHHWDGAIFSCGSRSYLCWTATPEITCALGYDPETVTEDTIVKIADSVLNSPAP